MRSIDSGQKKLKKLPTQGLTPVTSLAWPLAMMYIACNTAAAVDLRTELEMIKAQVSPAGNGTGVHSTQHHSGRDVARPAADRLWQEAF